MLWAETDFIEQASSLLGDLTNTGTVEQGEKWEG